jgi:hypothetical protein
MPNIFGANSNHQNLNQNNFSENKYLRREQQIDDKYTSN